MKREEFVQELTEDIIPFWNKLRDDENGGFTGFMDSSLNVDKNGEKGGILHSRILWFYSNAYIELKDEKLLDNAKHAYQFLTEKCLDKEYGGVYWSMNADGTVKEDIKHTYCQAFFIYALSSYYRASGDKNALKLAYEVMELVEKWEEEGHIFVIRPEVEPVSRTEQNVEKLTEFYDHGYQLMKQRMEEMQAYLEK